MTIDSLQPGHGGLRMGLLQDRLVYSEVTTGYDTKRSNSRSRRFQIMQVTSLMENTPKSDKVVSVIAHDPAMNPSTKII